MIPKTQVQAEDGKQEILITRPFELPVELLFKAYSEPELFAQWMGTNVIKMENKMHGSYAFETAHNGEVVFKANGTIHEFIPNKRITRTFEMEGTSFPVHLEYLDFESVDDTHSTLHMQMVFKSIYFRDQLLQMPFAQGLNSAHNRLQETLIKRI